MRDIRLARWHSIFVLAIFVALAICDTTAQNPSYQLIATGVQSSGADLPIGFNNWGAIALFNPATNHATLSFGSLEDVGALNNSPSYSVGVAVNDRFHVPGWSMVNGRTHAFVGSTNLPPSDLGTLGGISSWAYGINASDVVVGAAVTSTGATHAFSFNGHMRDLGAFAGGYSEARAINNAGQIAGDSTTVVNQKFHAFLLTGSTMRDLGTLGGTDSYSLGINSAGQVVGYSYIAGNTAIHPFLFTTSMRDLGTLGGNTSEATAINSLGQVVGWSLTATGAKHAFVFNGTSLVDLNSIVTNLNGWTLNSAWAINDAGEIAGYATDNNSQGQIFRLEPVVASNCVPNPYATQFADVNGDGLADEIAVNDNGIIVELSNGGVFQDGLAWSTVPFFGVYHIDGLTKGNAFFADVDGDGKADAIVVNDASTVVRRSNGANFMPTETWATGLIARSYHISGVSHPNIYFVDVNHDGAADAVSVDDNGIWVQLADKLNHVFLPATNWSGGAFYGTNGMFFADVNGDGMVDAIAVNHNQFSAALISVRQSTGSAFAAAQSWPALGYFPTAFADITGDGAADEIMNRGSAGLWVGPSTIGSFNFFKNPAWSSPAFYGDYATYYAEVDGNPNLPGSADPIAFNHDGIYVESSLGTSFRAPTNWSDPFLIYGTHDPICH